VEYARERGVRILPELDAPAHVGEGWQWAGPNVTVCVNAQPWNKYCVEPPCGQLNPTNDTVYEILGGIYHDIFALFDSDLFHMGGDEVRTKQYQ
jgi:hexosaminidase